MPDTEHPGIMFLKSVLEKLTEDNWCSVNSTVCNRIGMEQDLYYKYYL